VARLCGQRGNHLQQGSALWPISASSASLSQVRAMSIRMPCTLEFGASSAICRHSPARSLHLIGFITLRPRTVTPHLSYLAVLMNPVIRTANFESAVSFWAHTALRWSWARGRAKQQQRWRLSLRVSAEMSDAERGHQRPPAGHANGRRMFTSSNMT
jgi:hypothetical protein